MGSRNRIMESRIFLQLPRISEMRNDNHLSLKDQEEFSVLLIDVGIKPLLAIRK